MAAIVPIICGTSQGPNVLKDFLSTLCLTQSLLLNMLDLFKIHYIYTFSIHINSILTQTAVFEVYPCTVVVYRD